MSRETLKTLKINASSIKGSDVSFFGRVKSIVWQTLFNSSDFDKSFGEDGLGVTLIRTLGEGSYNIVFEVTKGRRSFSLRLSKTTESYKTKQEKINSKEIEGLDTQIEINKMCPTSNRVLCYGTYTCHPLTFSRSGRKVLQNQKIPGVFALLEYYPYTLYKTINTIHTLRLSNETIFRVSISAVTKLLTFLLCLGKLGKAHLDLKPQNIMCSLPLDPIYPWQNIKPRIARLKPEDVDKYFKGMTEEKIRSDRKEKNKTLGGLITKFVDQDDFISVIDFGFVDKFDSDYPEGFPGTPGYILPFKKGHSGVSKYNDLWSVGVIFYQLLTGKLPNSIEDYDRYEVYSLKPTTLEYLKISSRYGARTVRLLESFFEDVNPSIDPVQKILNSMSSVEISTDIVQFNSKSQSSSIQHDLDGFYKKHMSLTPRTDKKTDKKTDRGTGRDTDRKHDTLRKASPIKKTLKKTRV